METKAEVLPVMGGPLGFDQELAGILEEFELPFLQPCSDWSSDDNAGLQLALWAIDSASTSNPGREPSQEEAIQYTREQRRRMNDREKSKRHYYNNKKKRADMREEVDRLSEKLRDLLRNKENSSTWTYMRPSEEDLYRVSIAKSQLAAEKNGLLARLRGYNNRVENLQQCFQDEDPRSFAHDSSFDGPPKLTRRECREFCEKSAAIVADFNTDMKQATETTVCGWAKTVLVHAGQYQFSMSKTIVGHSAKALAAKTWRLITDPSYFCKMFKNLNMSVSLIQKVDEDNLVFLQQLTLVDDEKNVTMDQTTFLMSKIQVGDSYLLLTHHLGSDLSTWVSLDQLEPRSNGCVASYCGITDTIYPQVQRPWVAEIILHCLQWEKEVLGPRFSLPQSD